MIRPSFDIVPAEGSEEAIREGSLLMEIGDRLFTYAVFDKDRQQLIALRHYIVDNHSHSFVDSLSGIISADELLREKKHEALVIYNYPESNLVPSKLYDHSLMKPITDLVYGDLNRGMVLSEKIQAWDVYNIYRVPKDVHRLAIQQFAGGKYWHYYSLLLSSINKESLSFDGEIRLIFYTDRFICAAFKQNQLQLIQTFNYQTPEDVAYYILSICQQVNLDVNLVVIQLSGLIDEQSALFTELLKYFQLVNCQPAPAEINTAELLESYPPHYFSPLLNLALCV
jgi:hypothetical protein